MARKTSARASIKIRKKGRARPRQVMVDRRELLSRVDELEPRVINWLERDFDRDVKLLNAMTPADLKAFISRHMNQNALERARKGDLTPARKIAAKLTGVPEWVDIILKPPPPPWPTGKRKDYVNAGLVKRARGEMVGRVRKALKWATGLKLIRNDLLVEMAHRSLEIPADEIRQLIDNGYT